MSFYTRIGPLEIQTFTLALALAFAAALGWAVWRVPASRGAVVDTCLGALLGSVLGARLFHVLLNWTYFAYNMNEILRLRSGGLDWHGALFGGLAGLLLAARWRNVPVKHLLDTLALALPLLALAGWWGCRAANCAFGAEVDTLANYPALLVAELPDVYGIPAPRYNTQFIGLVLALTVLLITAALIWRGWLAARRFWLALALLSLGMFGIGFFRADYAVMVAGLRADQWLDLGALLVSLWGLIAPRSVRAVERSG